MKKNSLIISVIVIIVLMGIARVNPFKITDPSNLQFNPDNFSFNDYKNDPEMTETFQKLFPVGTKKEFVDKVLIKAGGALSNQAKLKGTEYKVIRYTEPYNPLRRAKEAGFHIFIYNPDDRVINIKPLGGPEIYRDQLTMDDVYKTANPVKGE